jgi:transposase
MDTVSVVGMDLHRDFSKVAMMSQDGKVLETRNIRHDSRKEMAEFFDGLEDGTAVVMEAGFNWPWVADLAEAAGMKPHLGHAIRCRELAKGMAKNDRKDAIFLAKLWLAGGDVFPEAYLAPQEVRVMRAKFRTRSLLVKIRSQMKNSIHGILHKYGVKCDEATDLYGKKGRKILDGLELPAVAKEEMERKLAFLDDLARHIDSIERQLQSELPLDKRAGLLQTIPGVGRIIAYGMLAEIGEIGRFPDKRALASYAGVLPLDNMSAGEDHGKHTNRRCNKALRWMALEAVRGAVRNSRRMRLLFERVKAKHPSTPGMAVVAVARELLEVAHLMLTRGVPYMENPPPRPGSVQTVDSCHPELLGTRGSRRASQMGRCAASERIQADN